MKESKIIEIKKGVYTIEDYDKSKKNRFSKEPNELINMPVFDKNHDKIGSFYSWTDKYWSTPHYGIYVDANLCQAWNIPYNSWGPLPHSSIREVKDKIILDKTIDELREYWNKNHSFNYSLEELKKYWYKYKQ